MVTLQAVQVRVSGGGRRLIYEGVARCVARCWVTGGTVENLNTLQGIVWGTEYGRFTTTNI